MKYRRHVYICHVDDPCDRNTSASTDTHVVPWWVGRLRRACDASCTSWVRREVMLVSCVLLLFTSSSGNLNLRASSATDRKCFPESLSTSPFWFSHSTWIPACCLPSAQSRTIHTRAFHESWTPSASAHRTSTAIPFFTSFIILWPTSNSLASKDAVIPCGVQSAVEGLAMGGSACNRAACTGFRAKQSGYVCKCAQIIARKTNYIHECQVHSLACVCIYMYM